MKNYTKRIISVLIAVILCMGMLNSVYALDENSIGDDTESNEDKVNAISVIEETPSDFIMNKSKYMLSYLINNFAEEIGVDKTQDYSLLITSSQTLQVNTSDNNIEYSDVYATYNNDIDQASRIGRIHYILDGNGNIINIQFNARTSSVTLDNSYFTINKNQINNVVQNETTLDIELLNQYCLNIMAPWCQSACISAVSRYYKHGEGGRPYATSNALLPVIYDRDNLYSHSSWDKNSKDFEDALELDKDIEYRYEYGMNSYQVKDTLEITGCGKTNLSYRGNYGYINGLVSSIRSGRPSIMGLEGENYGHAVVAFGTIGNNYIVGYDPVYKFAGDQLFILYSPNNINLANIVMIQPDDLILYSIGSLITPRNIRTEQTDTQSDGVDTNRELTIAEKLDNIKAEIQKEIDANKNSISLINPEQFNELNKADSKEYQFSELLKLENLADEYGEDQVGFKDKYKSYQKLYKDRYGITAEEFDAEYEKFKKEKEDNEENNISYTYVLEPERLKRAAADALGLEYEQYEFMSTHGEKSKVMVRDLIKDNTELYTVAFIINHSEQHQLADGTVQSPHINTGDLQFVFDESSVDNTSIFGSRGQASFIKRALSLRRHVASLGNTTASDVKSAIENNKFVILNMVNTADSSITCEYVVYGIENIESDIHYRMKLIDPYDVPLDLNDAITVEVNQSNLTDMTIAYNGQTFKVVRALMTDSDFGKETFDMNYNSFGNIK